MELAPIPPTKPSSRTATMEREDQRTWDAAKSFEASFIAETLKASGLNASPEGFGGGAGEEAFSSYLTQEYADIIARKGGFGLAEHIFESLKRKEDGR